MGFASSLMEDVDIYVLDVYVVEMICKECHGWTWDLVWSYALKEEATDVHMWQCKNCKRVVMASDNTAESEHAKV